MAKKHTGGGSSAPIRDTRGKTPTVASRARAAEEKKKEDRGEAYV